MKTLDRYILRQLITVTFLGVLSLTLLMLLGQLFKELHTLLVERGAPPSLVADFILQVIPFSLSFSVPWGFLTAVLLVYGRLAADNELTSMRMAGLSLWRLSMPAIGLGLVLSGLCYYINIEVAPKSKQAMNELALDAAMQTPKSLLQASQNSTKVDKVHIYIEKRTGDNLFGLHIFPGDDGLPGTKSGDKSAASGFSALHAQSATIGDFDTRTRQLDLELHHVTIDHMDKNGVASVPIIEKMPLKVHIPLSFPRKLKSNRYTNAELVEVLEHKDFVRDIDLKDLDRYSKAAAAAHAFPCADKLWSEAQQDANYYAIYMDEKNERSFRTESVQRASFSCACIVFSLIGVPLAITARRRDTSTGFAIGILVAAAYFVALVFCELSRKSAGITPYIVLWLPNIACLLFAIWQHQKAKYRG